MSTSRCVAIASTWCALLAMTAGCRPSVKLPPTVPASGTVTYNGQPLEGGTVTFVPTDMMTGKTASGVTDAQGNFQVQTFVSGTTQAKGALVGDYQVTVTKASATPAPVPKYMEGSLPTTAAGKKDNLEQSKNVLPANYADTQTSGLKATVKSSDNQPFTFVLIGDK